MSEAKSAVGTAWSAAYDAQVLLQAAESIEETHVNCNTSREQVATIRLLADERLDVVLAALEVAEEHLNKQRPQTKNKKGKKAA